MNKPKLSTILAVTAGLVTIGTLMSGIHTYHMLCKTEHALEVQLLEARLENAYEVIRINEQTINDLDVALEECLDVPIYNIPLDDALQRYTYETCKAYGIEDKYEVVLALMWRESDFNPEAVSSTDDYGLMQINKVNFCDTFEVVDALDPRANIDFGVRILADHYESYLDDNMTLMCYNFGRSAAESHFAAGTYASTYSLDILEKVKLIRTDQYYK